MPGRFDLDTEGKNKKRFGLEEDTKTKKRKSRQQEDRLAKKGGGRRVVASGALPGKPGDVEFDKFLVEAKRTDGIGIYLSDKKLLKAEDEAASQGCAPAVAFDLDGRTRGRKKWILIPEDVFFPMLEALGGSADKWA